MKIGILTYWWAYDNYGQLLQCYALQKYLRELGHDVYVIRYNYNNEIVWEKSSLFRRFSRALNPITLYRFLEKMCLKKVNNKRNLMRGFDEFRNKYISFSIDFYQKYEDLRTKAPVADMYIVGSDQVWNFTFADFNKVKSIIHAYMLDFGAENTKRFSYAASWGVSDISAELKNEIIPLLRKFDYVSVREQKGIDLCEQCGINNAEWVCDPTLLLDATVYRSMYAENKIRLPQKKYIFVYMLSNQCLFDLKTVYSFAKERNLDVVYVTGNYSDDRCKVFPATIPEWLYYIDNAEYVISNSFHCAVFSIIFYKRFGIVKLSGKHKGMNTRLDSLFDMFGISGRYIENNDLSVLDIPYKPMKIDIKNNFMEKMKI